MEPKKISGLGIAMNGRGLGRPRSMILTIPLHFFSINLFFSFPFLVTSLLFPTKEKERERLGFLEFYWLVFGGQLSYYSKRNPSVVFLNGNKKWKSFEVRIFCPNQNSSVSVLNYPMVCVILMMRRHWLPLTIFEHEKG